MDRTLPNGLAFCCRKCAAQASQKTVDLAREAVGCVCVFGGFCFNLLAAEVPISVDGRRYR